MKKNSLVLATIITVASFLMCFGFAFHLGTKVGAIRQWYMDKDLLEEKADEHNNKKG